MDEQRQEKPNGVGNRPALAAKKRRKGGDLQPIQTAAQQNGQLKTYASPAGASAAGSSNVAANYHSRYIPQFQIKDKDSR